MNNCFILYVLLTTSFMNALDNTSVEIEIKNKEDEIDADSLLIQDKSEQYCEIVIALYFKNYNHSLKPMLIPHIKPFIESIVVSPLPEHRHIARTLKKLSNKNNQLPINLSDKKLTEFVDLIVGQAISDAFINKMDSTPLPQKRCNNKVKIAALTLGGTIIGAIVTLTIHFTSN